MKTKKDAGEDMADMLDKRKQRYEELKKDNTATAARVEFLRECLEEGMSKREAARELSRVEPLLSHGSAETIVYMNFSGRYQTTKQSDRKPLVSNVSKARVKAPKSVEADEDLL